jgi:hypothetical protein
VWESEHSMLQHGDSGKNDKGSFAEHEKNAIVGFIAWFIAFLVLSSIKLRYNVVCAPCKYRPKVICAQALLVKLSVFYFDR